ncbi:MAG: helix-hairpin-helix domain-containing protein [Calditrichaceae bacterium]|nr:helix-hairpin-helix domain-containing protein [Calditrichaceae bacterium]
MVLTKSEKRALLFITAVLLASILVKWLIPHDTNTAIYDYSMEDSLFKALSADTVETDIQTAEVKKPLKSTHRKAGKSRKILKEKSVNINTADQKTLKKLPSIGPSTAKLIIEYREQNGFFKSIDELENVKRIGPKTLKKIEPYIFIKTATDSSKSY